jgi:hypothetical protein
VKGIGDVNIHETATIELEKHKLKYHNTIHNERKPINGDIFYSEDKDVTYLFINGEWDEFASIKFKGIE